MANSNDVSAETEKKAHIFQNDLAKLIGHHDEGTERLKYNSECAKMIHSAKLFLKLSDPIGSGTVPKFILQACIQLIVALGTSSGLTNANISEILGFYKQNSIFKYIRENIQSFDLSQSQQCLSDVQRVNLSLLIPCPKIANIF